MESVSQAKTLYGLIHARYITSSKGLALIREKYLNGIYGHCPRILCDKQILLPVGLSEDLKYSRVKVKLINYDQVYCPKCEDIYKPRQKCSDIDGAFFGASFPHVFLLVIIQFIQTYPDLNPKNYPEKTFIPKLYGFKLFGKKGSKYFDTVKKAKKYLKERSVENDREKVAVEDFIKRIGLINIS